MALSTFLALHGKFVIIGKQPDGDSIRFVADDPNLFASLRNAHRISPSRDGSVQLRLEGIDAPELHYQGETVRQPLGTEARDVLLTALGFSGITFRSGSDVVVTGSSPESVPGVILTKAADVHGRPIAYLLTGAAADALNNGDSLDVDAALLAQTMNHQMVENGMAYLFVYTSTPRLHREALREAGKKARQAHRGVYALDTTAHFTLDSQNDIAPDGQLILPKLFRRCTDYLRDQKNGFATGATLPQWMKMKPGENDRVVLFDGQMSFTNQVEVEFADLVRQVNDEIFVQTDIFNMTFVEK